MFRGLTIGGGGGTQTLPKVKRFQAKGLSNIFCFQLFAVDDFKRKIAETWPNNIELQSLRILEAKDTK